MLKQLGFVTLFAASAGVTLAVLSGCDTKAPSAESRMGSGTIGEPDSNKGGMTDWRVQARVYKPRWREATVERVAKLTVPAGLKIQKWAEDVKNARMLVVADDGKTVYLSRREQKDVLMLRDTDGDGRADVNQVVASRDPMLHGLVIHNGKMYLIAIREVFEADIRPDGTLGELKEIISGLPDAGQHPNRTIAFGPDGKLYISVGSTANAADEKNPENATMLVADPNNGWKREIFAKGLRNTIGFDWQPGTNALYGFDHGIDWLSDDAQQEEFNLLQRGKHYGWPFVYSNRQHNPQDEPPGEETFEQFAAKTETPLLGYTAHAAPMQFQFYRTSGSAGLGQQYVGDGFCSLRGSWNRFPPSGAEVVRVSFDKSTGKPTKIEPFITGFTYKVASEYERFARPVGLTFLGDGSMLFTDDENGLIYRVSKK